jgi:hypothetical protein
MILFTFLFMKLSRSRIPGRNLVELTRVDSSLFLKKLIFSNFVFYHLVCLSVYLHYFIQFLLWGVIPISWLSHEFGVLTWVGCFYPLLKLIFFQFILQFLLCLWLSYEFLFFFIKLSHSYLFFYYQIISLKYFNDI